MATRTWNAASGQTDMNNGNNYTPTGTILTTDDLVWNNTSVINCTATANLSVKSITVNSNYSGTWSCGNKNIVTSGDQVYNKPVSLTTGTHSCVNFTNSGAATTLTNGTLNISGNITIGAQIASGTVNLTNSGTTTYTLTATPTSHTCSYFCSGSVVFSGAFNLNVNRFVCTPNKTYTFVAGQTYIIIAPTAGDLNGTASNLVTFASSSPNTQYLLKITASGAFAVSYVSVQDCDSSTSTGIFTADANCVRNTLVGGWAWPTAATFYIDYVTGASSNLGTEASPWKLLDDATAAKGLAAGDTIKVFKSPDAVAVGTVQATWTKGSATVTLDSNPCNALVTSCDTVWVTSQGANVVPTADATQRKEGSYSAKLQMLAGATTGNIAYFNTGTLNLTAYSQLSFWIYSSVACPAGTFSIRLWDDLGGTGNYDNFVVPGPLIATNWCPCTVNLGTTIRANIKSVSLYMDTDLGAATVQIDDIIACLATSATNFLSLNSLISKPPKTQWAANTAYSVNDIRVPTHLKESNRYYKCTTGGTSHTTTEPVWPDGPTGATITDGSVVWTDQGIDINASWCPIQSINGTTIILDNSYAALPNTTLNKYPGTGTTETLWRRDCIVPSFVSPLQTQQVNGTAANTIKIYHGYNSTSHTVDGYTYYDLCGQIAQCFTSTARNFTYMVFVGIVRCSSYSFGNSNFGLGSTLSKSQLVGNSTGISIYSSGLTGYGVVIRHTNLSFSAATGMPIQAPLAWTRIISALICDNLTGFSAVNYNTLLNIPKLSYCEFYYNTTACTVSNIAQLYACITANNTTVLSAGYTGNILTNNCTHSEGSPYTLTATTDSRIIALNVGKTVGNHVITLEGATFTAQTAIRQVTIGIAWCLAVTSTVRTIGYPARFEIARIECPANKTTTIGCMVYRDIADITAQVCIPAYQILNVNSDITANSTLYGLSEGNPQWEELQLQVTSAVTGFVSVEARGWGGTTGNAYFHTVRIISVV